MTSDQTDKLVAALNKISKRLTIITIAQETQAELLTAFFARVDYYLQVNSEDIRFTNPNHSHSGMEDHKATDDWYYEINSLISRKVGVPANEIHMGSSGEFLMEDDKEWKEEMERLDEEAGFLSDDDSEEDDKKSHS